MAMMITVKMRKIHLCWDYQQKIIDPIQWTNGFRKSNVNDEERSTLVAITLPFHIANSMSKWYSLSLKKWERLMKQPIKWNGFPVVGVDNFEWKPVWCFTYAYNLLPLPCYICIFLKKITFFMKGLKKLDDCDFLKKIFNPFSRWKHQNFQPNNLENIFKTFMNQLKIHFSCWMH